MLKHIITIALVLVAALSVRADEKEYYNLAGKADQAIKDGKWEEAESYLRQAMRLDPANPSNVLLLSNLGMVQHYDGRDDDAIATLSDAHIMTPNSVTVLLNRAKVLTSLGYEDRAMSDYSRVISLDSTLVEPRFYRSMMLLGRGDTINARNDIDTLQAMAPSDRLTHVATASLLIHNGDYAEAIPHLSTAIELHPDPSYYSSRALCFLLTDNPGAAAEDIGRGLQLDPTDGELYLLRAMLNKMRYRPDDAKADGEKAIKFGVNPERVRLLLAH